ncbi:hypothetical protein RRG08_053399 [Elysia crispata]|uniref:Uncharacterized protein n=1 Tax=Elysia crispata TaxID=231223 RepID=A0AAE1DEB4_9GAST|nr:hypothetical protein RRG08_053399 [Elysia crispata]
MRHGGAKLRGCDKVGQSLEDAIRWWKAQRVRYGGAKLRGCYTVGQSLEDEIRGALSHHAGETASHQGHHYEHPHHHVAAFRR